MRSGWLQKAGAVLLVFGLAVGPWPSALAASSMPAGVAHAGPAHDSAAPMHAAHAAVDGQDVAAPCPAHTAPVAAAATPDCCDDHSGCAHTTACALSFCGPGHALSPLPALATIVLLAPGAGRADRIPAAHGELLACERLRPPIA